MSKFGITRLPDESEEDFRRRYHREKMRIYRADKPKSDRKRGKGKKPLANGSLSQEEWESLQPREGETVDEHKKRYRREYMRIRRSRPDEKARERDWRLQNYAENIEDHRAQKRAYRAANPDVQKRADKRHYERNGEKRRAASRAWIKANPEKAAAMRAAWNAANRALLASYSAAWRRAARIATPPWADFEKITAFYVEARRLTEETGIEHQVDHIVPLRGRGVRGLHVHTNLRVIPAVENFRKHNTMDHQFVEALMWSDILALGAAHEEVL